MKNPIGDLSLANQFSKSYPNQQSVEFNRYKQDCRKRALDLAHSQILTPKWQETIRQEEILIKDLEGENYIVSETILIGLADKYYNWLISIPE
jgi:hypothetical protein